MCIFDWELRLYIHPVPKNANNPNGLLSKQPFLSDIKFYVTSKRICVLKIRTLHGFFDYYLNLLPNSSQPQLTKVISMATYIEPIIGKKGTTYKVRYRIGGKNKCKTFATYEQAKRYEKQLDSLPKCMGRVTVPTLGETIIKLLDDNKTKDAIRGAASNLRMLLNYDIAGIQTDVLRGSDLVEHCEIRKQDLSRPNPATLYHDITNIISSMKLANTLFNLNVDINSLTEGKATLYKLKFISNSTARTRRPSSNELDQILDLAAITQAKLKVKLPLFDVIMLVLETAIRRGEVVKITWGDYNAEKESITIRERKDPKKPIDQDICLSPEAIAIIERQPKGNLNEAIFPFSASTITTNWCALCKQLKISNLHFHDLRAEAACRYYLQGWNIVQIAKQTGHKDLNTLNDFYLRLGLTERQLLKAA